MKTSRRHYQNSKSEQEYVTPRLSNMVCSTISRTKGLGTERKSQRATFIISDG